MASKRMTSQPNTSPAMQLLELVWGNTNGATGHSWERLNHAMQDALSLAINAGLRFDADDFKALGRFDPGYWIGPDGGEWAYSLAVAVDNQSAIKAFEKHAGRPPLIGDNVNLYVNASGVHGQTASRTRGRLAVGSVFDYAGVRPTVTSFKGDAAIACTYKVSENGASYPKKIDRRFRITGDDLIRDRAERKAKRKENANGE